MSYIVCSDIHLGHKRTSTSHIINNFKTFILSPENKNISVLFIAGDLFDRKLDLNTEDVRYILSFFYYLLSYCHDNNIELRVLEGTPSHDWNQSYILYHLNESRKSKCKLKYIRVLDIEYIEVLQKYVLYIPDEWLHEHDKLEAAIEKKLYENNIKAVDIAILHGQFEYQIRGNINTFFFKEQYFLSKVREYIHIGHYHSFSTYDRIIANGSFDRLAFGEEEPKGYVKVENNSYTFIENKNAYIYKTIKLSSKTTLEKLDIIISKYPLNSYIRLVLPLNSIILNLIDKLKVRYLNYNIKIVKENEEKPNEVNVLYMNENDLSNIDNINIENIHTYLFESITSKHSLSNAQKTKLSSLLLST